MTKVAPVLHSTGAFINVMVSMHIRDFHGVRGASNGESLPAVPLGEPEGCRPALGGTSSPRTPAYRPLSLLRTTPQERHHPRSSSGEILLSPTRGSPIAIPSPSRPSTVT